MDCLFPIECLGCGKQGFWLCNDCLMAITTKTDFPCIVCGKPTIFGKTHKECLGKTYINGAMCAASYEDDLIQQAIHVFKYKFITGLGPPLAWLMAKFLKQLQNHILPKSILKKGLSPYNLMLLKMAPGFLFASYSKNNTPLLIPVPLHSKRLRERGFNQAEILARGLGKYLGWPVAANVLIRKRYTSAQMKLKSKDREANIKNAFEINTNPNLPFDSAPLHEGRLSTLSSRPKGGSREQGRRIISESTRPTSPASELDGGQANATNDDAAELNNDIQIKNRTVALIDDVLTTGATTNAAAKALKIAGVKEVWVFCLARD